MLTCNTTKPDGTKCRCLAIQGDDKCFFHSTNPDVVAKRKEAEVTGGQNGRKQMLKPTEEELRLNCIDDVAVLIARTINDVRQNRVTTGQANCIGFLAGNLAKIYEIRDVQVKVESIELILKKRGDGNG